MADEDHKDLLPTQTAGYKVGEAKSADQYAAMDAGDESLARWKASLGIGAGGAGGSGTGPKLTAISLELTSSSLPPGKRVSLDLTSQQKIDALKKNPVTIKEGVEYQVQLTFQVNHSIISGLRYIQLVKRAGVKVDKLEQMLGSYGVNPSGEPYVKKFDPEESPSGMLARSGSYSVRSRIIDDDQEIHADFDWAFKIGKEW